jgi:TonB family protein
VATRRCYLEVVSLRTSMKFCRPFVCVIVALFAFRLCAVDTYEQELSSALANRILILRNYYTDAQLTFDSNGQPVSKTTRGFGPSDGRIYVQRVQLEPGKLTLSGTCPLDVFEPRSQEWQVAPTATTVSIEMLLPAGEAVKAGVPHVINTVFLKKSEVAEVECTAAEQQEFIQEWQDHLNHPNPKKAPKLPDATALGDLHPFCLPGGDRVYRVGRGITAPRAKYAPDPKYSDGARNARLQGTTVLLAIVTPEGKPTAISIQRSLGVGLTDKLRPFGYQLDQRAVEAVSQWKFDPATFQGKPIAVVINVEVNFRLY